MQLLTESCMLHTPHLSYFFLTFKIEFIISLELKVQLIFCLHIRVPYDEGFEIIPLLNAF